MGSPTYCFRAENKQKPIENKIMTEFQKRPTGWYRYVDDTFKLWDSDMVQLQEFLDKTNTIDRNIQFTLKKNPACYNKVN